MGYSKTYLEKQVNQHLIRDVREIINVILKQHKGIKIKWNGNSRRIPYKKNKRNNRKD